MVCVHHIYDLWMVFHYKNNNSNKRNVCKCVNVGMIVMQLRLQLNEENNN